MYNPNDLTTKQYRTIIRLEAIGQKTLWIHICAWKNKSFLIDRSIVPEEFLQGNPKHLIARVNVGAEKASDLIFSDFEIAPEPDPNDGLI